MKVNSLAQLRVIAHLYPDRERYLLQLVREVGIHSGSLTAAVRTLIERGWLRRRLELGDERELGRRRRRYVSLTEEGRAEGRELLDPYVAAWARGVFGEGPSYEDKLQPVQHEPVPASPSQPEPVPANPSQSEVVPASPSHSRIEPES